MDHIGRELADDSVECPSRSNDPDDGCDQLAGIESQAPGRLREIDDVNTLSAEHLL